MDTIRTMPDSRIDRLFLLLLSQLQAQEKHSNCAQKLSVKVSEFRISLTSSDRHLAAEAYQIAEDLLENPLFEGLAIEIWEPHRFYGVAPARVFLRIG
ncbi:hypothetical protein [Leptolyngbya ohadii]|uniref:hypothetical protein n=1 Tax=Leptolyngbya ohadii TaxID=1962290 RepID=UPI000B59E24E|nr:hypothetical protein [Leptolyngbya ohadii]